MNDLEPNIENYPFDKKNHKYFEVSFYKMIFEFGENIFTILAH